LYSVNTMSKRPSTLVTLSLTIVVLLMLASAFTGSVKAQEVITEEEFERRFQENPEALYESCVTNETVTVVTDTSHGTWYALLWKKVRDAEGNPMSHATVTVTVPSDADVKADWFNPWQTGGSVSDQTFWGLAAIWFRWNTDPNRRSITVHVNVYKDGFQPTDEYVTIYGNWRDSSSGCGCRYRCNYFPNTLYPPSTVPEFPVETSLVMSFATAFYLVIKRRKLNVSGI